MPANTQRADVLYSCFACVMGTASCWKLSPLAQLQEQLCVRGVHSPSAVPAPATAVARSLLVFHAVSSDLIRIGPRPPTPLNSHSFLSALTIFLLALCRESHPEASQILHFQPSDGVIFVFLYGITLNQELS